MKLRSSVASPPARRGNRLAALLALGALLAACGQKGALKMAPAAPAGTASAPASAPAQK